MHPPMPKRKGPPSTWRDRLSALRNVKPLLALVWETSPSLALATTGLRLVRAFIPLAILWVSKGIIDLVVARVTGNVGDTRILWMLLGAKLGLAIFSDLLGRGIALSDSLLGDRFTNVVSVRLMKHASALDLANFEDPVFYDRLERARRQTTGRLT